MSSASPTVGLIIIGDEILKGHVQDTNSSFLCKRLFSLGVKVKKISVIGDDLDTIANEVREFSSKYTHVITSGGIGPTHDDLTYEGVAKAFDEQVKPHADLVALCKKFFGTDDLSSPKLKLAFIPESAKLHYGIDNTTGKRHPYPFVAVKNIFVFPGVPSLMERAFFMLEESLRNPDTSFHTREIYVNKDEISITAKLNEANEKFKEKVILGSYPDFHNNYYKVKLTLEAENMEDLNQASTFLNENLPVGSVVEFEKDPITNAVQWVYGLPDCEENSRFKTNVQNAIKDIEECLDKYSLSEICVGFNGGKDCTLLLHLFYAVVKKKYPNHLGKLKALYIRRGLPFPEIELFIQKSARRYNLDLITINGRIKDSLGVLKTEQSQIKGVVMGTRSSDPYSEHLSSFSKTDSDWPEYMRVNPILNWSYQDVWKFLRKLSLQYCPLYDRGYTSIGSMENTHPNPSLQSIDDKGSITYKPAYELMNDNSERAGRN